MTKQTKGKDKKKSYFYPDEFYLKPLLSIFDLGLLGQATVKQLMTLGQWLVDEVDMDVMGSTPAYRKKVRAKYRKRLKRLVK